MKRPRLTVCSSCRTDEAWDGETFFQSLKKERRAQGLKAAFKLVAIDCLRGCDTPCNARLEGKGRPRLDVTWLHGVADVQPLLDAAVRYAGARGEVTHQSLELPGRPAPRE